MEKLHSIYQELIKTCYDTVYYTSVGVRSTSRYTSFYINLGRSFNTLRGKLLAILRPNLLACSKSFKPLVSLGESDQKTFNMWSSKNSVRILYIRTFTYEKFHSIMKSLSRFLGKMKLMKFYFISYIIIIRNKNTGIRMQNSVTDGGEISIIKPNIKWQKP